MSYSDEVSGLVQFIDLSDKLSVYVAIDDTNRVKYVGLCHSLTSQRGTDGSRVARHQLQEAFDCR